MALLKLGQSCLPILGHWKVAKTVIKGQRGQKTTGNLLPCTTSHSSAPADSLALSGPFLLHNFSQAEVFLLGCPVTHLAAGILTSVFCPETGYFTVLSGAFLLQHVQILLWITVKSHILGSQKCLLLFFQFSSISVWELLTAFWLSLTLRMLLGLNSKPLFRFRFCYTAFHLQRMYTFPCTYSNQKKAGSFIPKSLLIPSLWALLHHWASSWQRTIFGYTAVMSFSEDPSL